MSELDRIYDLMQHEFTEINNKLTVLQENQAYHKKDIEYIKQEINGKLDERIDNKILKFKFKTLIALITGTAGSIGLIISVIKFFAG